MLNNGSIVGAVFPLLICSTRQISMLSHSTEQGRFYHTVVLRDIHILDENRAMND